MPDVPSPVSIRGRTALMDLQGHGKMSGCLFCKALHVFRSKRTQDIPPNIDKPADDPCHGFHYETQ